MPRIRENEAPGKKELIIIGFKSVLFAIGIIILFNRIIRGICYTDEMWYIAEPYIVSQGAVPYVNNWTQAAGFTIPLAAVFKLFCVVNKGTEGIVLFSRLLYAGWLIVVCLWTFFIIKRRRGTGVPFQVIFPLLFMTPFQLYAINYNTIGLVYLMPICALVFTGWNRAETKTEFYIGIPAGLLMARTIIGTPNTLIAFVFFVIFLLVKKKRKMFTGFIVGCGIMTVAVVGYCCILGGGVEELVEGLIFMFSDMGYFKIEGVPFLDKVIALRGFLKPFAACMTAAFGLKLIFFKKQDLYRYILVVLLYSFAFYGICKGWSGYPSGYARMISWCWFETIILSIFYPEDKHKKYIHALSLTVIVYFLVYVFVSFTNISGFGSRAFWLFVPSVLTYIGLYIVCRGNRFRPCCYETLLTISMLTLGACMIKTSYGYVFDDEAVQMLDARVDSGIWKGLYTTEEKRNYIYLLEREIGGIIDEDSKVLFMDWSSFAYLMSDGTACAPSSYDSCIYAYKVNEPQIMYDYFSQIGDIPDDIVYIDFGKDEMLSIADPTWKFNEFVLLNYSLTDVRESEGLKILHYELAFQ